MRDKVKILFLSIATSLFVVANAFWGYIFVWTGGDIQAYQGEPYKGNGLDIFWINIAVFLFVLSLYLYINEKFTITFIMLWLSFGNLFDEIMGDNYLILLVYKEFYYLAVVLILAYIYNRWRKKITDKP
jgi:hypothetical protein